ncbi:sec1 family domain-containing protein 2-like isoform X2 [Ceratina calcarata]|uniref:Sec1 family domain-containing protein 2-like isoform X2 n=1 Tax=Ceratina calcarata TaxID=156304 RepID=A0AAJ7N9H9_9HYME|nr:sec1 family domain-containing protein 2-like isoform X2 [Ceratina calcarata]
MYFSRDPAFYQRTIKMILAKNTFDVCLLYCSAPCCTVSSTGIFPIEQELNYINLKRDIKTWMASGNIFKEFIVDITYIPIFIAFLNKDLFVTPPFGDMMPPLDTNIPNDTLINLNLLAYSFCNLFDSINATIDVYSIGRLSDHLAENVENYISSINQRAVSSEVPEIGVSLILVDRTLDLCTATSNSTESFLTKILRTLPRLPHHDNDVAINMEPVFGTATESLKSYNVPGCLASVEKNMMDLFISQKEKMLLNKANQLLNDMVLTKDSPKLKMSTRISGRSLEKVLNKIQTTNNDSLTVYIEKLECILAIIEASTSQTAGQQELLTSLEKLALQNLSVSRESSSILLQLSNIIRTRIHRGLNTENLLALLIHVYALAGTQIRFSTQQERQLIESVADAIFEDLQALKENPFTSTKSTYQRTLLLSGANDVPAARETACRIATRISDILRLIAEQRLTLQDYRYFMTNSQEVIKHTGILEQITKDVFSADRTRELRDIRKKSASLISAGFNLLLGGKTKRHPHSNPYVLIYVVGGITADEAKIVQEVALAHVNKQSPNLILAGSRLLNPLDVVDKIFFC